MSYQERFVHFATVESESTPGKTYEVKQDTQTGLLSCSCPAWRFKHEPTNERVCKHIRPLLERAGYGYDSGSIGRLNRLREQISDRPIFHNETDLQKAVLEAMA
jgi:transposase InsO family protein